MADKEFRSFSAVPKFEGKFTIAPNSINASTVSVQTFTINGLQANYVPVVAMSDIEFSDVRLISARVSAKNTLELTFFNFGGSTRAMSATEPIYLTCL